MPRKYVEKGLLCSWNTTINLGGVATQTRQPTPPTMTGYHGAYLHRYNGQLREETAKLPSSLAAMQQSTRGGAET